MPKGHPDEPWLKLLAGPVAGVGMLLRYILHR
jgi:hypothetical protein